MEYCLKPPFFCLSALLASLFAPQAKAFDEEGSAYSHLQIDYQNRYVTEQQSAPQGFLDPYSGEYVEIGSFVDSDYSAPRNSYQYAIQDDNGQYGLSYQITKGLSLNVDPTTRRLHSDLNLTGSEKRRLRLRINPKRFKVEYEIRW